MVVLLACATFAQAADAPPSTVAFRFTPVPRAQMALWIEAPDGTFLATVRLTQAVSYYGIGNRPGASQMNSGFQWPYGRREGVLPLWAHRRAAASGAQPFRRVIFQDRREGAASQTASDASPDPHFCLSFQQSLSRQDALDAVTCASQFSSDKGRYLQPAEAGIYAEPVQMGNAGAMRALGTESLYPARRDVSPCTTAACNDSADLAQYAADARAAMPDIDAITMATAEGGISREVLFTLPATWAGSDFVAWLEINVEGDHDDTFSAEAYPTPQSPADQWDGYAIRFGYPYRGQPSVVFSVPFSRFQTSTSAVTEPVGYGSLSGYGENGGALHPLDGTIANDPVSAPGSGVDRLAAVGPDGTRLSVEIRECQASAPPGQVSDFVLRPVDDAKHSHEWGTLSFVPPADSSGALHYEARYGRAPINDDESFMRALPALQADIDSKALVMPTSPDATGRIAAAFGGMIPLTTYQVAVRAINACNQAGPLTTAALTTTKIHFTKLPPVRPWKGQCFVATAAFGSPMAPAVEAIRKVRNAARERSGLFTAVDDLYHLAAPPAADALARSETARAVARELLGPVARASALMQLADALPH